MLYTVFEISHPNRHIRMKHQKTTMAELQKQLADLQSISQVAQVQLLNGGVEQEPVQPLINGANVQSTQQQASEVIQRLKTYLYHAQMNDTQISNVIQYLDVNNKEFIQKQLNLIMKEK